MKILINCPSNFNISAHSLKKTGGIEALNFDLANFLAKKNMKISISSLCKKSIKKNNIINLPIEFIKKNIKKYKFDAIISSNDSTIFNYFPNSKIFLWMHNKLQIEKSIRKKQLFSILKNKPNVIFVSEYLKNITTEIYPFKTRYVIPNFLTSDFIPRLCAYKRNPIFVWSVQRDRGLYDTIDMWIDYIYPASNNAKFYIFGINKFNLKYKIHYLNSKNIFFKGRVSRKKLKEIYIKSTAMICLGYDETFCLNALEANSCGLPVFTFGKTALKELIINNYNGFVVNDFKALAIKILSFLEKKTKDQQKFRNNAIIFSKKYLLSNIVYKWLKLLK